MRIEKHYLSHFLGGNISLIMYLYKNNLLKIQFFLNERNKRV